MAIVAWKTERRSRSDRKHPPSHKDPQATDQKKARAKAVERPDGCAIFPPQIHLRSGGLDDQLCPASPQRRARWHKPNGKRRQFPGEQAHEQVPANAMVRNRCEPNSSNPCCSHKRRFPEVPKGGLTVSVQAIYGPLKRAEERAAPKMAFGSLTIIIGNSILLFYNNMLERSFSGARGFSADT